MIRERNYGIEALRLLFMYVICVMHLMWRGGIVPSCAAGTAQYGVFWLLEVSGYCSVNVFGIISGYTAVDKPRRYEKIVDMWMQAFFYSFVVTVILTALGLDDEWSASKIGLCALPVMFGNYWYFTAYFALFFAIPLLNKFLFAVDERTAKRAFVTIAVLFSFLTISSDPFKTNVGYSAIWLMVLYCIGALAKRIKLFETRSSLTLLVWWALCVLSTWGVFMIAGSRYLMEFTSPTILLNGIIPVVLFSRLRIKGTTIARATPYVFGIYLLQLNPVIWDNVLKGAFAGIADMPVILGVISLLAWSFAVFAIGFAVEVARSKIAQRIGVPQLSKRIAASCEAAVDRLSVLLK